jgi:glycosyltransferase involved in cell wall biosynthesis
VRLTFPIETLSLGGAQRMLVELANGTAAAGHEVAIVMPPGAEVEFDVRVPIMVLPSGLADVDAYPAADLIVSNFFSTVGPAAHAARLGKGCHVRLALCYEPLFLEQDVPQSFRSYFESERLMVLSHASRALVHVLHGIEARVIPAGVGSAFRDLGLRGGPPTVVAVVRGGWVWHRDQDHLLEELERIRVARPDVRIRLVCPAGELRAHDQGDASAIGEPPRHSGTGEFLRSLLGPLRAPLGNLRLRFRRVRDPVEPDPVEPTKTRFVPPRGFEVVSPRDDEEMCRVYSGADVFVASSVHGSIDLPPLEAMRCGAAVAVVYSGGNAEYLRDGENGLISYRHEDRLASDVLRLLGDDELRRRLAEAGRQEAERWTWDRATEVFLEVVEDFVRRA